MINFNDTICAPATTAGSGAISVIRISGPDALTVADKVVSCKHGNLAEAAGYTVKFGTVSRTDGVVLDDVLVTVFRSPHSYTGEDSAEISCHASTYIVSELLSVLCAAGCRLATPGEFTRRAFIAGKMDLSQAEAVADLISATSGIEHRIAINQLRGGYSSELKDLHSQLLQLSALLELELDFSEEEVEFASRDKLRSLAEEAASRCEALAASFRTGNALKNGIPVAIIGAPNSGKSTLLNALLRDDRSIVSDIPGTTRDTVEEVCVIDGIKFRFIDTAGIRRTSDKVETLGIERSYAAMEKALIVVGVVDATSTDVKAETERLRKIFGEKRNGTARLIIALNKTDRPESVRIPASRSVLPISALTGDGLDRLESMLVSAAGPDDSTQMLVTNARHAASLNAAATSLRLVISGLTTSLPTDLIAEDLRAALSSLGSITGEISTEEVLGEIFGKFCIGK